MRFDGEWLDRADSFEGYLTKADMNVPTMKQNFEEITVKEEDHVYFTGLCSKLPAGAIKILAISESWCGDCVENLPIVAKLASLYPCFHLLVFSRDDNLDIMDRYLTSGRRTIPVFVFFDETGTEIGRFVERPKGASEFLNQEMSKYAHLPEAERKRASYGVRTQLRKLYKSRFREETIREIRRILENRYEP
ncbi:MAG: thioredoxin family protein [Bacillota bacterium]|jgi:thiol-disulfide isomerase/thioredoxin|nr:thioredoxin family protein [Candidatus Fermentithermobacillaceae bacterium]